MIQLEELKLELEIIKNNIRRVEKFIDENKGNGYRPPRSSHVFGELKHRLIAFKGTITSITKISTRDLF